jgi:hypothetical protein
VGAGDATICRADSCAGDGSPALDVGDALPGARRSSGADSGVRHLVHELLFGSDPTPVNKPDDGRL